MPVSTRAALTLLETRPGGAPVFQSTFPGTLNGLTYRDASGKYWTLEQLPPGRKMQASPFLPEEEPEDPPRCTSGHPWNRRAGNWAPSPPCLPLTGKNLRHRLRPRHSPAARITMSTPLLLEVSGLSKSFGPLKAVNNASFVIRQGQVVGLIGSNGAGKTTLMRMLATLEMPDSGHIRLNGADVVDHPELARSRIGWMPDYFHPYKNTSVREYLDFFARACGMGRERLLDAVDEVMDFTELASLQNQMIDKLSKGQTQRLCLARTLISDAQFLILDEPAAGLDPKARLEFKNLVHLLKARGKTLLISSHILSELGKCATPSSS
ncbi:ABC transporter ATP-binding protein [Akkermansia muciniphila]|nr:ABC transporter ATP-binding protein [Akkermansia muciniphila]